MTAPCRYSGRHDTTTRECTSWHNRKEAMSVESISWALRVQDLTPTDKLVLIGIANHDGDGGSWPAVSTLAMYAGVSERTVQRAIAALQQRGLINVETNAGGTMHTRNDRRPNFYTINRPRHGVTSTTPRQENGVTPVTSRGDIAVSPEPSLNHQELSLAQLSLSVSAGSRFDEFWKVWPKRVGKGAAIRAYERALKRATHEQIVTGAKQMAALWAVMSEQDRRYVPYPERWLNSDRWADETLQDVPFEVPKVARPDDNCPVCEGFGWVTVDEEANLMDRCECWR